MGPRELPALGVPRGREMRAALALLLRTTVSIGCVQQRDLPDDCSAATVKRDASLSGDLLDPEATACAGQAGLASTVRSTISTSKASAASKSPVSNSFLPSTRQIWLAKSA